jgi:chemotaxis protein CheZ
MSDSSQQYRRDQVVNIINSVIKKVEATEVISREALYNELQNLHRLIEELRKEVSTSPEEILERHIPSATDELDAIVDSTAVATGTIMDACEEIEKIAEEVDQNAASKLTDQVVKVYEACSFQDITGQRITKVINTLKQIDAKVERILAAFGSEEEQSGKSGLSQKPLPLENGPQLPEKAISQEEIDNLLAEFD